jgi:hypothetical protein
MGGNGRYGRRHHGLRAVMTAVAAAVLAALCAAPAALALPPDFTDSKC